MIKPPGKPGIAIYLSTKTTKKDTYEDSWELKPVGCCKKRPPLAVRDAGNEKWNDPEKKHPTGGFLGPLGSFPRSLLSMVTESWKSSTLSGLIFDKMGGPVPRERKPQV